MNTVLLSLLRAAIAMIASAGGNSNDSNAENGLELALGGSGGVDSAWFFALIPNPATKTAVGAQKRARTRSRRPLRGGFCAVFRAESESGDESGLGAGKFYFLPNFRF